VMQVKCVKAPAIFRNLLLEDFFPFSNAPTEFFSAGDVLEFGQKVQNPASTLTGSHSTEKVSLHLPASTVSVRGTPSFHEIESMAFCVC